MYSQKVLTNSIFFLIFILYAIWNIPDTIAGRYIVSGLLLVCVACRKTPWWGLLVQNKWLIFLSAYLFAHLFFLSDDFDRSLKGFKSEWLYFILYSIVGLGSGWHLARCSNKKILFYFAFASSVPILIQLILVLAKAIDTGNFPWGHYGLSSNTHGDIAYASLMCMIFTSICYLFTAQKNIEKIFCIFLMTASIISPLIARSRGGLIFSLIPLIVVCLIYIYFLKKANPIKRPLKVYFSTSIFLFILIISSIYVSKTTNAEHWQGFTQKLIFGFKADSIKFLCEGPKSYFNSNNNIEKLSESEEGFLNSLNEGDATRMAVLNAGILLALKYPLGVDQTKQSFEIALNRVCSPPFVMISHAHNGWIDTAISIGIPGALILFLIYFQYFCFGFANLYKNSKINPYSLALVLMTSVWFMRALFDSSLRDQMLETQSFTLALLLGFIISKNNSIKTN